MSVDQFCFVTVPTCGPAFANAPLLSASSRVRKKVYDSVTVWTSLVSGSSLIAGSIQKVNGNSIVCPGSRTCLLKQKHAVLWKYFAAFSGVTLYRATPVVADRALLCAV